MNPLDAIIGTSPLIAALRSQVDRLVGQPRAGQRMPSLLIQGESGVGKGLLARAIHHASGRRQGPWVDLNCAAIPESLIEAELFGAERGAFTDARERRPGLFQSADRGVLFLDEIGALPVTAQAKLLTAVEEQQVRRLGSSRPERVDVWIISATNDDLRAAVEQRRFRADLYHRLAGVTLQVPPLRERGRDVLELAEHYLARACLEYGLPAKQLTAAAQAALCAYAWPGNVRELANLMERVAMLTDATRIGPEALDLPRPAGSHREPGPLAIAHGPETERETLLAALEATRWSLSRAAARLGVPRSTLRYRIEKLGLTRTEERAPAPEVRTPPLAEVRGAVASPVASARPTSLRWERRWVTALSTTLAPLDGAPFGLTPVLEDLTEKLQGFGAHLEAIHPRGFLALFGLEPVEDAPSRAVHAAWAALKAVERVQRDVGVTCAIHARECLIGRGGTIVGMDPADKQQLLASLEALGTAATPPGVLVSSETARFIERRFELAALGGAAGAGSPAAYRLVGRGSRAAGPAPRGGGAPYLGRDRELAILDDFLVQAEQSRGQAVGLSGEPGIGKSRLLYEFCQGLEPGRVTYVEGRCVSYGQAIPYLPVLDFVRQDFSLDDTDPPAVVAEKVEAGLRALGLDVHALVPFFLHLLGIKDRTESPLGVLNPESIKLRTIDALRQLGVARSRERVIVIALEDVHWIDHASEEVLTALVESAAGCRMLLLCTYRPGYRPPWLTRSYATQLVLGRLSSRDSVAIVRALVGGREMPADLTGVIVARADGNPFYLEELARAWDQAEAGDAAAIPDTIQGVLAARIDRLPPAEKDLLGAAAVLGKDVVVPVLRQLVGLGEPDIGQTLAQLRAGEFLVETSVAPRLTYAFKHGLTQEVAYANVPAERRQALHARAAAAIEDLAPDVAARTPEVLAHHYTRASLPDKALNYWHRAGTRAVARSANVEAISHLRHGLALLESLPAGPERKQLELLFLLTLATPTIMVQGYAAAEAAALFERARAICAEVGDSPGLFPALYGLWRYYFVRAHYTEAERLVADVRGIAEAEGVPSLVVAARVASGLTSFYVGRLSEAEADLRDALERYDPADSDLYAQLLGEDPRIPALTHLTWARYLQGAPDDAVAIARRALAEARATGHPFGVTYACHFLAVTYQFRREHEPACQAAAQETAIALENQFRFFVPQGQMIRGASLGLSGHGDEGLDLITQGLAAYRGGGAGIGVTYNLASLAAVLGRQGRVAEALRVVDEGLAVVESTGERFWESELWRTKGELLLEAEARDGAGAPGSGLPRGASAGLAERCLEDALRQARDRGAKVLEIRAATSLAGSWLRSGRHREAERLLEECLGAAPDGPGLAPDVVEARRALAALRTPPG